MAQPITRLKPNRKSMKRPEDQSPYTDTCVCLREVWVFAVCVVCIDKQASLETKAHSHCCTHTYRGMTKQRDVKKKVHHRLCAESRCRAGQQRPKTESFAVFHSICLWVSLYLTPLDINVCLQI